MSRHFYTPTLNGVADWQKLLADPAKHWRTGYSARTLAHCWENASGFPPEVAALLAGGNLAALPPVQFLLGFPEHPVVMPPNGGHPSQNDLFVLARAGDGQLMTVMVEGKVSEPFGDTLGHWNAEHSPGKALRLAFIQQQLGLTGELPANTRYQLLHRTASAVVEAARFNARHAAMIVHSFNQADLWFEEYQAFLGLFGLAAAEPGRLYTLKTIREITLYSGWARGTQQFLSM